MLPIDHACTIKRQHISEHDNTSFHIFESEPGMPFEWLKAFAIVRIKLRNLKLTITVS